MIILRYSQTFLEANTYIVADEHQKVALVVDTGAGSCQWIKETLAEHGLSLGAVLLTHGHADHVWDVSGVVDDEPVYIPEPDLYRLDNPLEHLGMPQFAIAFGRMGIDTWSVPSNLQTLPAQFYEESVEIVPGVVLRAIATPGHTEGSSVFLFAGRAIAAGPHSIGDTGRNEQFMLSGDVIFNNGIGRTDLPGGDDQKMAASLRFLVQVIKPETVIFPGHGPQTTMFHETRHSQYLHAAMS
ncbi:glyoxylase-like metal-dependent hydrolase (beta-lactamase superfamily II) [Arcanobacterium pluranimalium]|uniref:MBL fold metallo-hydrolase n=1 Tax=Arcanobacterium pluranimalium TaxID=108028 RepID=UPI00195F1559|nr:MBL fold metallo-hydrolase [Arcanobacterium pluranimalium]MBM7825460.1 glyoxylase-like metal-dependent hydrolase (beta-lactamase superfamily II) [Arcanobacterium pluranimalium]